MEQVFPFLCEKNHVISLVGGGGKTTLMYVLARSYRDKGCKTLVTTTTHIVRPAKEEGIYAENLEEVERLWDWGRIAVIGTAEKSGKLAAPNEAFLTRACELADVVLIEADGAKRLPCKVPAEAEPVILPGCDIVIGVAGLDAVGQRLGDICFRKERAMELLAVSEEHRMNEEDIARILLSEEGTRKGVGDRRYYIVLNKCDDERRLKIGRRICEIIRKSDACHAAASIVMTHFDGIKGTAVGELGPYLPGEGR